MEYCTNKDAEIEEGDADKMTEVQLALHRMEEKTDLFSKRQAYVEMQLEFLMQAFDGPLSGRTHERNESRLI